MVRQLIEVHHANQGHLTERGLCVCVALTMCRPQLSACVCFTCRGSLRGTDTHQLTHVFVQPPHAACGVSPERLALAEKKKEKCASGVLSSCPVFQLATQRPVSCGISDPSRVTGWTDLACQFDDVSILDIETLTAHTQPVRNCSHARCHARSYRTCFNIKQMETALGPLPTPSCRSFVNVAFMGYLAPQKKRGYAPGFLVDFVTWFLQGFYQAKNVFRENCRVENHGLCPLKCLGVQGSGFQVLRVKVFRP